ncbi:hypothetical protein BDK51DRAFT_42018, partial [Blyttiomyces helicus]
MRVSTAITAFAAIAAGVSADLSKFNDYSACEKVITRKEIHDVTSAEWAEWTKSIQALATTNKVVLDINRIGADGQQQLNAVGGLGNLTIWEQVGFLHNYLSPHIHGNNIFLLFHRKFTAWVEQLMIEANPNFSGMFYWSTELVPTPPQWSVDSVWNNLGQAQGDGMPIANGPIPNVDFWVISPNDASLPSAAGMPVLRGYELNNLTSFNNEDFYFASADFYNNAFVHTKNQGFHAYADIVEGLHGYFHNAQGGTSGHMAYMWSPLDF